MKGIMSYALFMEELICYVMFLLLIVRVRAKKNSVIVFLFVVSCLWFICKSNLNYDTETMFPVIMGLLFLLIVENKDRKKALVAYVYVIFLFGIVVYIPTYALSIIIGKYVFVYSKNYLATLFCRSFFIICMLLYNFLRKKFKWKSWSNIFNSLQRKLIFISLLCFNIITVAHSIILRGETAKPILYHAVAVVTILMLLMLFAFIFWQAQTSIKSSEIIKEKEQYKYIVKSQEQYIQNIINRDNEIRKYKHDSNARLVVMRDLAKNNPEELLKYIDKQMSDITDNNHCYTSNSTVDAIISSLKKDMDDKKIQLVVSGRCMVHNSEIILDVCICIYNFLLNAIEACEKLEEKDRKIVFNITTLNEKLFLRVSNPCNDIPNTDSITDFSSTKEDKNNHGFGCKNASELINRHNGKVNFAVKDNCFIVEALI